MDVRENKNAEYCDQMIVRDHNLSNEDVQRFSRQILVQEFGVQGQQQLRASSLLIVGAGGLGCPVALYCAGAGVGRIGIVDHDIISTDNLHRQIAYDEYHVGQSKAECLKESIGGLNSNVDVHVYKMYLSKLNVMDLITNYDIVADCTDNAPTRYLINDACVLLKKPLVSGSALRWDGQLSVYCYGENCPCYRCVYPEPPPMDAVANCSENGVIGPVVGVIGSMQAMEIVKIAATGNCSFAGSLYMFDGFNGRTKTIKLRGRKAECIICGENPKITTIRDSEEFYSCSAGVDRHFLDKNERIEPLSYFELSKSAVGDGPLLIDTRPPHEFSIGHLPQAINMPMSKLFRLKSSEVLRELGTDVDKMKEKGVCVICRRGNDSQDAVLYLREMFEGLAISFKDIDGGYVKWSNTVDMDFPMY